MLKYLVLLLFVVNYSTAQTNLIGFSKFGQEGQLNSGGKIFSMNLDGSNFLTLQSFEAQNFGLPFPGGAFPDKLILGSDGYIYGMMNQYYDYSGAYIFKMKSDGSEFQSIFQGIGEVRSFLEGPDGYFYGSSYGYIFKIRKDGSDFTKLAEYDGMIFTIMGSNEKLYWLEGNSIYWMKTDSSEKMPFYTFSNPIQYGFLHKMQNGDFLLFYLGGWPDPFNPDHIIWDYSLLHFTENGQILHQMAYPDGDLPPKIISTGNENVFTWNGCVHISDSYFDANCWLENCQVASISPDFLASNGKIYGGSLDSIYQAHGVYSFDPLTHQCEEIVPANSPELGTGNHIACEIVNPPASVTNYIHADKWLKIYPTPAFSTDRIKMTLKGFENGDVTIIMTDLVGQKIYEKKAQSFKELPLEVDMSNPGVYNVQVWQQGKMIGIGKVLIL